MLLQPPAVKRYSLINFITTALLLLFFCITTRAQTQGTDSTASYGSIKGMVFDSSYNFALSSSSIALYKLADSSLLNYTLPNNYGEFLLKPIPFNTPVQLVLTHVGYKTLVKPITITAAKPEHDLGKLYLDRKGDDDSSTVENEVVVTGVIPMRMNGDTLEFNAAAFKMDKNATAEDLMRRLPGFTIWGDGEMTFNGKTISSVLVNGKPFMGGDASVATQNIAKDAIQKIQVYQQKNENNPLDSVMHANIKTKEEKNTGHFGKASVGYGSDKRYALDGMFGMFNPKMQISVVAATNNINKTARSLSQLIQQASYKGIGANIDYQTDFRMAGLNKPIAAGANFQYDFIADPTYYKSSRLTGDYFFRRNNTLTERNTTTNIFTGDNSLLTQEAVAVNSNISANHSLQTSFAKRNEKLNTTLNAGMNLGQTSSRSESNETQRNATGLVSTNNAIRTNNNDTRQFNLGLNLNRMDNNYRKFNRFSKRVNLGYKLNVVDDNGRSTNNSAFTSYVPGQDNRTYSRLYDKQDKLSVTNDITIEYPEIKKLIFGKMRLWNINVSLRAAAVLTNNKYDDRVLDFDAGLNKHILNTYLTNKRDEDIFNFKPNLGVSKGFFKQLSNRYTKSVFISATLEAQYYSYKHQATNISQNFNYKYWNMIPNISVSRMNEQHGAYSINYSLSYNSSFKYPDLFHIAPLVDSSNIWFIPKGNPAIKPQENRNLGLNFQYSSRKAKNPFSFNINAGIGNASDYITDSSFYNAAGVRTNYYTNINGFRNANLNTTVRKSIKVKQHAYQVGVRLGGFISRTPQFIEDVYRIAKNLNSNGAITIDYSFKDVVTIQAEQGIGYNESKQTGMNNNVFIARNYNTQLSGSLQLPKNLTWSSNVTYFRNSSNNQAPVNFTIWNASLTYRFLKANRGEVKCSALDLLRQNKNIINLASPNSQTFGYQNTLQQYYMITLSYFPRKFGK